MWTKPHYRPIKASDVTVGMKIYSKLLGEAFTVEKIFHRNIENRIELKEGCFSLMAAPDRVVFRETMPRCLR